MEGFSALHGAMPVRVDRGRYRGVGCGDAFGGVSFQPVGDLGTVGVGSAVSVYRVGYAAGIRQIVAGGITAHGIIRPGNVVGLGGPGNDLGRRMGKQVSA